MKSQRTGRGDQTHQDNDQPIIGYDPTCSVANCVARAIQANSFGHRYGFLPPHKRFLKMVRCGRRSKEAHFKFFQANLQLF